MPSIHLDSGLEIGYGTPLATFGEAVELTAGTHFLLARNGRGKTTLLRTLAGTQKPVSGSFKVDGFLQYLPEDLRFDASITPSMIFRTLLPKDRLADALALASRIELDVKKPYGRLSTGNRRKTSLIVAEFSVKPGCGNVLLLDEPFSGLDAFARQEFEEIWKNSASNVLRLVSCHPDYDSMEMPSALLIESHKGRYLNDNGQTWRGLKNLMN
ncbi:ATP-binding cassette domain-containing protein [Luteolibacter yonseiensis]|uniref:ATP-binding cassette domain-containing protein n=1 Tax=Luteolibacter yonseiensis TaxID=1144680 RepID=A0A934R500_9BACT|nr:ATP-binding cassette domain-containing protein [Luteolibacter yonseiensis]MBK1815284.1 ATP-binding cassette domain-containing protein [Luteolibacter yonseiensis]